MIVNCKTCNEELIRNNSQIKASKTGFFFCNRDCKSLWHKEVYLENKITSKCLNCDTEYKGTKSKLNVKFCSNKCIGEYKSKNTKVTLKCDYCNSEFQKIPSQIKDTNLCSVKCRSIWNSEKSLKVTLSCIICNNSYEVSNSRKNTAKTCSKECHYLHIKDISNNGHMKALLIKNGLKAVLRMKKFDTLPEKLTESYLIENNVKYIKQLKMYDRYYVDFYLPDYDMVLEVMGDYWHGNPMFYNDEIGNLTEYHILKREKDRKRKEYLQSKGHKFIYIWEYDVHNNIDILKSLILN